jgi:putative transposase
MGYTSGPFAGSAKRPGRRVNPWTSISSSSPPVLDGEKIARLCREFSVSRKTGYKILSPYNDTGLQALTDRSRRPYPHANRLPFQIETLILHLKQDKPASGAPKIRERLRRPYPDVHCP